MGHHRETAPGLARPRRLDRRVESQQVGLLGDGADLVRDPADAVERFGQVARLLLDRGHVLGQGAQARQRIVNLPASRRHLILRPGGHRTRGSSRRVDVARSGGHDGGFAAQLVQDGNLMGDAAADILDMSGHIGERHAKAADFPRQLADRGLGLGRQSPRRWQE